jgi:lysine 2,3-aminomutase
VDAAGGLTQVSNDFAKTLRTPRELVATGLIEGEAIAALALVMARYATAITPAIAGLIESGNPADPIARQFIPTAAEADIKPHESADPIGDERHSPVPGIVHRYRDRVLLKLTHVCPVYCRFCFRREMVGPGKDQVLSAKALEAALAYIAGHDEIWEVILTGGDPLMLSPRRLAQVTQRLDDIAHVKVIRWHTRMPIADPARIDHGLVRALKSDKAVFVAVHVNHARELSAAARAAAARLIEAGIPLLSQSVLLKGVNDTIGTLEELMRSLVEARIQPYYLHHLDAAPGTSHFAVPIETGRALMRELRARASGLCLPTYVLDIPGGHAKALLSSSDAEHSAGSYNIRDAAGVWHRYEGP